MKKSMSLFLLMNTKEDILKNDWKFGTIDFHSIYFFYYGSQSFFKTSFFVFIGRKKLIQICNNLRVNDDRIFNFG